MNRFGIPDLIIAVVIGAFFAVSLYGALGNLLTLPGYLASFGLSEYTPWATLVASLIVPVVLFVAGILVGRGRATFVRTLILIVALAVNSAITLSLTSIGLTLIPTGL